MKNILTLAIVGMILWNGTVKLAEFALKNHKQIARISSEVRGMPLAVHARTVEANAVIDWSTKQ